MCYPQGVCKQPAESQQFEIKWDYIRQFNVQEIAAKHQTQTIKNFIKYFKRLSLSDNPSDYNNPLIVNLLKLCQLSCEMLVEGSIKYKTVIYEKEDIIDKIQDKYILLEETYRKARNLLEQLKGEINPCPICKRKFKSPEFLDKHIAQKHPEYLKSWSNIRKGIPDSYDDAPTKANIEVNINNTQDNKKDLIPMLKESEHVAKEEESIQISIYEIDDSDEQKLSNIEDDKKFLIENDKKQQQVPKTRRKVKIRRRMHKKDYKEYESDEKEEEKKEHKVKRKNDMMSQIEDGLLQTSLLDPSTLEIYENNSDSSFMDSSSFTDSFNEE